MAHSTTKIATAFVEIKPDTRNFESSLDAQVTKSASGLGKKFAQLFGAAAFGAGLRKAINDASDLNETVTKTEQIFGDAAKQIEATGETAAKSMGMSKKAYLDSASSLKGLLDNMGLAQDESTAWSQKMVQLGSDLASFFNTEPADAVYAISAALRGESEPLRRYNVQLSEVTLKAKAMELGLYSGKGALDLHAKAQAALALIMEQTTAAQGDFARTADGVANSQRIAKAEMENASASAGQNFLPVYQKVVETVGFLAKGFGALPGPVQTVLIAFVGLVALSGPLGGVVDTVKSLTNAIQEMAISGPQALAIMAGLAIAAGAAYLILRNRVDQAEVRAKKFYETVSEGVQTIDLQRLAFLSAAEAADEYADAAYGEADKKLRETILENKDYVNILKTLGLTIDQVAVITRGGAEADEVMLQTREGILKQAREITGFQDLQGTSTEELTRAYQEHGVAITGTERKQIQQIQTMNDFISVLGDTNRAQFDSVEIARDRLAVGDLEAAMWLKSTGAYEDLNTAEKAHVEALLDEKAAAQETTGAQGDLNAAQEEGAKTTVKLKDRFDDAADAADGLRDAIDEVFGKKKSYNEAADALAASVDDLTTSFKENGKTLDGNTAKGRANRKAVQDQADAILDFTVALVENGASQEDAATMAKALVTQLEDQLVALGLTREEAEDYITTLGLTPESIDTAVSITNAESTKATLQTMLDQLGEIDEGAAAEIQTLIDKGMYNTAAKKIEELATAKQIKLSVHLVPGQAKITVRGDTTSMDGYNVKWKARGDIVDRPQVVGVGEDGVEAIIPLTKPREMAQLLSDPRVGGPISQAMGGGASGLAVYGDVNIGSREDLVEFERRINRMMWRGK